MRMSSARADQLDPAALAALGRLELVARWVVDGFINGLHRSPRKGFSVEFAEHRPYQSGDDLRYLDWKIAARADRWVVKLFEEETNARAVVVLDVSKSMHWTGSDTRLTKMSYAEHLAAALSLLLVKQRDAVGLVRFDSEVRTVLPVRGSQKHWNRLVTSFDEPGAGDKSDVVAALNRAGSMIQRPGFVLLLSDLLVETEPVTDALKALRARGHECLVAHIMDPVERDFPEEGEAMYRDTESGQQVPAATADIAQAYRETVKEAVDEWRAAIGRSGARYTLALTNEAYNRPMRELMARGGATTSSVL